MMLVATHAQGYAGIWRTGSFAYDARIRQGMGLEEGDEIIGFLYLGTASAVKKLKPLEPSDFVHYWNGPP